MKLQNLFAVCALMMATQVSAIDYKTHQGTDAHALTFDVPRSWELDEEELTSNGTEWEVSYDAPTVGYGDMFPTSLMVSGEDIGKALTADQALRAVIEEMTEYDEEDDVRIEITLYGDEQVEGMHLTMKDGKGSAFAESYVPVKHVSNGAISMLAMDMSDFASKVDGGFFQSIGETPKVANYMFTQGTWFYAVTCQATESEYAKHADEFSHMIESLHFNK